MRKSPAAKHGDLEGVIETLKTGKSFFLAGHMRPDGDTLGSALALALTLRTWGKKPEIYTQDPIPAVFSFLPGLELVRAQKKATKRFDAAILLECGTPDRMGDLLDLKTQAGTVVNIDHHKTSEAYGTFNLIDPASSSNAEQIYHLLLKMGAPITKDVATCLYVGVATDTGRFHYSNTTASTLQTTAELLKAGIEASKINDRLFASRPLPSLRLLGRAINSLRQECGGRLAVMTLSREDFQAAGADLEHCEEIVNYGLMPEGIAASVLVKEAKDRVFVSMRSRGVIDVSSVAAHFGGGGHHNASGCQFHEPLKMAVLRVEAALCQAIKEALG